MKKSIKEELAEIRFVSSGEVPFIHSSRFHNEKEAVTAYDTIQQILRDNDDITISAYRLFQNWQEAEPSSRPWFVAILGDTPSEPIAREMLTILKMGQIAPMPDNVIARLVKLNIDRKEELIETNKFYQERHHNHLN